MKKSINQRGVAVYISVVVMTVLLGVSLGVSSIFYSQVSALQGLGDSVTAFYAAEAGIEQVLYIDEKVVSKIAPGETVPEKCDIVKLGSDVGQVARSARGNCVLGMVLRELQESSLGSGISKDFELPNRAVYRVRVDPVSLDDGVACPEAPVSGHERSYCAKSTGEFEKSQRSIRISR
ncbi:MAG: hypothetical protein Q8P70_01175 [bacterium]|nr:hypothetical protein [bacterium]